MGKRQRRRRRDRDAGAAEPPRRMRLGAPGPYMVCRECGEPVNLLSEVDPADEYAGAEERLLYLHSRESVDAAGGEILGGYDHEAVPVEGDPVSAGTVCDFCYGPGPKWAFVPRRAVRVPDPVLGGEHDYSSPWECCDRCLQTVRSRSMTRMLDRTMSSPYNTALEEFPGADDQRLLRATVRAIYAEYLRSDPAGPYERMIRDEPPSLGKRGSLRGA